MQQTRWKRDSQLVGSLPGQQTSERPSKVISGFRRCVSFTVFIRDLDQNATQGRIRAPFARQFKTLEAGRSYAVDVQIAPGVSPGIWYEVASENIRLDVYCAPQEDVADDTEPIEFLPASHDVSLAGSQPQTISFQFTVPPNYPAGEVSIAVFRFEDKSTTSIPYPVQTLPVTIRSNTYLPQKADLEHLSVPDHRSLPAHLAVINVERMSDDEQSSVFWISGFNVAARLPQQHIQLPRSILPTLMARKDKTRIPTYILEWMKLHSELLSTRLHEWLATLWSAYGDDLTVLIVEASPSDYPWEMIAVTERDMLGARASVARWFPVHIRDLAYNVGVDACQRAGQVMSYLVEGNNDMFAEMQSLLALNSDLSTEATAFLNHLQSLAQSQLHAIALVYLGCHGEFTADPLALDRISFGPQEAGEADDDNEAMTLLDLNNIVNFQRRIPLVLANACHSGRLSYRAIGIAHVFLARVAESYIGTLSKVGAVFASEVASAFLDSARNEAGVNPAMFLREQRRRAMLAYQDVRSSLAAHSTTGAIPARHTRALNDMAARVLYAFSYVYFGNPFMSIALNSVVAKGA